MASGSEELSFYFKFKSHMWLLSTVLGYTALDSEIVCQKGIRTAGENESRKEARECRLCVCCVCSFNRVVMGSGTESGIQVKA